MEKFKERLLFPIKKKTIVNTITRSTQSSNSVKDDFMKNFLTEIKLTNIAENTWKKIVEKYEEYGMIISGIIMTLVISQFIKIMIGLIIRGCALHALYGWSMKLLGAFFSSVTHLLVVLNKENTTQNIRKPVGEELELKKIVINRPTITNPILKNSTVQRRVEFEIPPRKTSKFKKFRPLHPIPSSVPITDMRRFTSTVPARGARAPNRTISNSCL